MSKLILKFEERLLREIPIGKEPVTIGRLGNNTIVLDNPAVSSYHARLLVQGEQCVLVDLDSLNGTFVNSQRITRHILRDGDVVQVGKHSLVFQLSPKEEAVPLTAEAGPRSSPPIQDLGGTVILDTKRQKELLGKMAGAAQAKKAAAESAPAAAIPAQLGVLTVLSGSTDKPEYVLESQTALIGKSAAALVRLKGWFKPKVAATITRRGTSFVLTPLEGKTRVNNRPLTQRYEIEDGDVLYISGVTLQFTRED
ncbi:MAG: FHA domain-containing protein [Terriglobia bacterium]